MTTRRWKRQDSEQIARNLRDADSMLNMRDEQFPDDDRLFKLVREAKRSVFDLHLALHYLSCDGMVRPRDK